MGNSPKVQSGAGLAGKLIVVGVLMIAVVGVLMLKNRPEAPLEQHPAESAQKLDQAFDLSEKKLPLLLDLGADQCIPCKMMKPILDTLQTEYAGRMQVKFIDVWKNPDAGKQYGIRTIPTQIFYNAEGKELFRHEGFMSREDILAKWKELGGQW